jgi:hypothetical protein
LKPSSLTWLLKRLKYNSPFKTIWQQWPISIVGEPQIYVVDSSKIK